MPLLAIECPIDHIPGVAQRGSELTIKIGVVLNDQ
jgi:hypothetical protein